MNMLPLLLTAALLPQTDCDTACASASCLEIVVVDTDLRLSYELTLQSACASNPKGKVTASTASVLATTLTVACQGNDPVTCLCVDAEADAAQDTGLLPLTTGLVSAGAACGPFDWEGMAFGGITGGGGTIVMSGQLLYRTGSNASIEDGPMMPPTAPFGAGVVDSADPDITNRRTLLLGAGTVGTSSSLAPHWSGICAVQASLDIDLALAYMTYIGGTCSDAPGSQAGGGGAHQLQLRISGKDASENPFQIVHHGVLGIVDVAGTLQPVALGVLGNVPYDQNANMHGGVLTLPLTLPDGAKDVRAEFTMGPVSNDDGDFDGNGCIDPGDISYMVGLVYAPTGSTQGTDIDEEAYDARADFDLDGDIDVADLYLFLEAYRLRADLDSDGDVDGADLTLLLGNMGICNTTPCLGDLDCNGLVDADDLTRLQASYD